MSDPVALLDFTTDLLAGYVGESVAAKYLSEYLRELQVSSLAFEPHYVDRHYLDDFANYYAKSFQTPPPHCARLHFFRGIDAPRLEQLFDRAFDGQKERTETENELNERYLGFVVRRPLNAAPIGRAVLRTYSPDGGRRHYQVVRPYHVHLVGLHLRVDGLAYQQQDGGAAVCASTALWSALQRVAKVAGHRTPTPYSITQAAKSPFPASHGLMEHQMAEAISSLSYTADRFVPAENRPLFRAKLMACLDSQLPVVLGIVRKVRTGAGETVAGHAVTVTGYAQPQTVGDVPTDFEGVEPLRMLSSTLDTLYVHDDNLGFHAHYEIFDSTEKDEHGNKILKLRRGRTNKKNPEWWSPDVWDVESALVPKPDKMRLPLEDLFLNVVEHRPTIGQMFPSVDLHYGIRFRSGVEYVNHIVCSALDGEDLRRFVRSASLPRHLVTLSVYTTQDRLLVEVIMDATTVARDPSRPNVLAIIAPGVPKDSPAWARVAAIADVLSVPFVPAPRT